MTNENYECNKGQPYTVDLKLTGCNPAGEFTCNDGQCVTMNQRCNQLANCIDKSDERGCQLVVVEEGYNKQVPPIVPIEGQDDFSPALVNISIDLLKIVDMDETNHKIDFQLQIMLEWRENRVAYLNLKLKTSLNTLPDRERNLLWLPLVIYDNTDQKDVTRLGVDWEWATHVSILREGNYTECESNPSCRRSGIEVADEEEIFEGGQNSLRMEQVYTRQFQCYYQLQLYPFDNQVIQAMK